MTAPIATVWCARCGDRSGAKVAEVVRGPNRSVAVRQLVTVDAEADDRQREWFVLLRTVEEMERVRPSPGDTVPLSGQVPVTVRCVRHGTALLSLSEVEAALQQPRQRGRTARLTVHHSV